MQCQDWFILSEVPYMYILSPMCKNCSNKSTVWNFHCANYITWWTCRLITEIYPRIGHYLTNKAALEAQKIGPLGRWTASAASAGVPSRASDVYIMIGYLDFNSFLLFTMENMQGHKISGKHQWVNSVALGFSYKRKGLE